MGKGKCKLDKNQKYKLDTILEIIMTLDYSNALSSSNDDSENDTTFNNNSEDSNKSKEIIQPSLKCMRKNSMKKHKK